MQLRAIRRKLSGRCERQGKQGHLAAVVISAEVLAELGLVIVRVPGDTSNTEVNALHVEARLPLWRRLMLRICGEKLHEFFNAKLSQPLCDVARIVADEKEPA
jgi:hypothetical protein